MNAHFGLLPSASTQSSSACTSATVMDAPRCVSCTSGRACMQCSAPSLHSAIAGAVHCAERAWQGLMCEFCRHTGCLVLQHAELPDTSEQLQHAGQPIWALLRLVRKG